MTKEETKLTEVLNFLLKKKGLAERATFPSHLCFSKDLGLDSLDLAELTVRIEDDLGVDLFAKGVIRTIGEARERLALSRRDKAA